MADNLTKNKLPRISSPEIEKKFSEKMHNISADAKEQEAMAKASLGNWQYIDLKGFPISPEALILISQDKAKQLRLICFYWTTNDIRLAAVNPNLPEVKEIAQKLNDDYNTKVQIYLISENSFLHAFKLYDNIPKIKEEVSGVKITAEDIIRFEKGIKTFKDLSHNLLKVSTTDSLALILAAATKSRASDVHLETEANVVKVRFRIDGLLHEVAEIRTKNWPDILSRIKLIAGLKINVYNRPQDGRFTIFLRNEEIDVRVSSLPTAYGESVVIRLLMSTTSGFSFEGLGLRGRPFEQLKIEIQKPNGMIITTGPTGSGKTTTLYAILNRLNSPTSKIITIEDPIEYKLVGINQSQVDPSTKYTFANGLRNIVRQDPDIIMVGEIRDLETAEIAINAALTGHLVITTLHTNDAAGTIPRLLAMNVKPFLVAPAINAMIGQRLVRKICQNCKKEIELDNQTFSRVVKILSAIPTESGTKVANQDLKKLKFYKGGGCEECQGLGYKDRVGIFEIMTMNKEIEKLILHGQVSEYDMRDIAIKSGMITMIQDGLLKAADGITTVEEVFRVAKDITTTI
ncbi:MAG: type II/IV secretion system protein [Candidatus Buchananbacteria bacterium]|nr:type II/IV secretion system protein [Candidatus Buchananbacteria bacterium]